MIYALGIVMPSDTHNFSRGMRSLDPAKPFGTSTVAQAVHEDSLIRKYQVIYTLRLLSASFIRAALLCW